MTGPVQVLVVGFDQVVHTGDVMAELERLRRAGTVRLLDVLVVKRAEDGTFHTLPAPAGASGYGHASRHDLTDSEWAALAPLLPAGRRPGRPPTWTKRQLIDGIRWRIRVGAPAGGRRVVRAEPEGR